MDKGAASVAGTEEDLARCAPNKRVILVVLVEHIVAITIDTEFVDFFEILSVTLRLKPQTLLNLIQDVRA